ncbi:hypothetical protein LTR62_005109 [Meristemomyces frigidus]|uniref:Nitrogen regulatory protein areA GATA-like domain-containing protein n=1 Tax=Meristemomyces frigidus TaxID=1508187 RepID=A0AAN7TWF8_9PEZI|nr:hypothetical protein LTR62_005109 [Meristemomyces frigidus]
MAQVITSPRAPSGEHLYEPSGGLKRSHASTSDLSTFLSSPPDLSTWTSAPHPPRQDSPQSNYSDPPSSNTSHVALPSLSIPSSTPEIGALSLEEKFGGSDVLEFPDYGGVQFYHQSERYAGSQSSEEPVESTTTETTASDSPLPTPTVADDTAIRREPKQHVDYLSHDWREEDIWSSWRHIVSQRRVYGQRSRLENASWRTWAKSKYALPTVSPEKLNWLKESDVTWLYGPLKPAESHPLTSNLSEPVMELSKSNSFIAKKPILKKRSVSEVMLSKSISTSSLMGRATASLEAQKSMPRMSAYQRMRSDFPTSSFTSETPSRDQIDYFTSRDHSSENATPNEYQSKRHIRFDDKVEQCIALDCKYDDQEEDAESDSEEEFGRSGTESSSDDGVIMMKRRKRSRTVRDATGDRSSSHSRRMIETLPASTLKYRAESPAVDEAQQHHTFGKAWGGTNRLSPSASQETLRPSRPAANFLLQDEEEDAVTDSSWSFGASNPKSSLGSASSSEDESSSRSRRKNKMAATRSRSQTPGPPDDYSADGLRRTNSGMLMPYDDEEDDAMAVGLFGRVSETINTAKDIAHVIWNVGWRK